MLNRKVVTIIAAYLPNNGRNPRKLRASKKQNRINNHGRLKKQSRGFPTLFSW